jgi:hypothetical protein
MTRACRCLIVSRTSSLGRDSPAFTESPPNSMQDAGLLALVVAAHIIVEGAG